MKKTTLPLLGKRKVILGATYLCPGTTRTGLAFGGQRQRSNVGTASALVQHNGPCESYVPMAMCVRSGTKPKVTIFLTTLRSSDLANGLRTKLILRLMTMTTLRERIGQ